ncbi:hypothetical protein CDAR_614101 [Caerostris darwini]|uniref:Uncharacterized protein n=1 Tax=Caerostris darwini TaxID=1538125 RepID=A0AAV4X5S6_9ARAC|nr:hypothetical protein CDAR_614101 [Caerostris darwini]
MSDNSDSDYENAVFYPVLLPHPIREDVFPDRENELVVHQRPLMVCNQPSGRGPNYVQDHQWHVGVVSHYSLRLKRERDVLRRTLRTEDLNDVAAYLALQGPARDLRTTQWVYEYSSNSEPRRNATDLKFRTRRFLSRSSARSLFDL